MIARGVGQIIMWSVVCVQMERDRLSRGIFETDIQADLVEQLVTVVKDLMMFAGMIRYKLPPRVYEALARAAGYPGGVM